MPLLGSLNSTFKDTKKVRLNSRTEHDNRKRISPQDLLLWDITFQGIHVCPFESAICKASKHMNRHCTWTGPLPSDVFGCDFFSTAAAVILSTKRNINMKDHSRHHSVPHNTSYRHIQPFFQCFCKYKFILYAFPSFCSPLSLSSVLTAFLNMRLNGPVAENS
jgi:hypothetical protein